MHNYTLKNANVQAEEWQPGTKIENVVEVPGGMVPDVITTLAQELGLVRFGHLHLDDPEYDYILAPGDYVVVPPNGAPFGMSKAVFEEEYSSDTPTAPSSSSSSSSSFSSSGRVRVPVDKPASAPLSAPAPALSPVDLDSAPADSTTSARTTSSDND